MSAAKMTKETARMWILHHMMLGMPWPSPMTPILFCPGCPAAQEAGTTWSDVFAAADVWEWGEEARLASIRSKSP